MKRNGLGGLALAATLVAGACGGGEGASGAGGERLRVVTTVAPLTSIVANVAGDRAEVTGLVPEGTNSHTFEPPPSAAEVLSRADVLFVNGLRLEEPTQELAEENLPERAVTVSLGDRAISEEDYVYDFSFPKEEGKPNPHLWTNPPLAKRYAEVVRDTLVEADEANAEAYRANYGRYAAKIDALDRAVREATATLAKERRKLLTYHDAYAYFAATYDWDVIGAIQVENFEEPTPREVAALVEQVRAEKVPAIFGSEVFPSPVLEQIGKETGVRYVDVLRDDDLPGAPGDPEHSYLGLMRFDYVTMVKTLGGDASALEALDVADLVADRAYY